MSGIGYTKNRPIRRHRLRGILVYNVTIRYLISGVGYTKIWPIRRHRLWGILVYNVTIHYLISGVGYTKIWPIRRHRHRHRHRSWGISMHKAPVSYLNQRHRLYKKSANMSASASGNISIQCHHLFFKSVALAIQKVGQYIGIGISIEEYPSPVSLLYI